MRQLHLAFILLSIATVLGCRGPYVARSEADREAGKSAVVMDDYSEDSVSITAQYMETLPDGRMAVVAQLYNRLDTLLSLQVQVDFRNDAGYSSGETSNWELIQIGPYETSTFRVPSLSSSAVSYVLRIRKPLYGGQ